MKISDAGRKFIESFEGLSLHAYRDSAGVWTIGYGHTSAAGLPRVLPGMMITEAQADAILSVDLQHVELDIDHHVRTIINQNQYDALSSFDFNTGALDRSNVLRAVNTARWTEVPHDLSLWCHAGGRVVDGLVRRRKAEGVLFMKPVS